MITTNIQTHHVARAHWDAGVTGVTIVGNRARQVRIHLGSYTSEPKAVRGARDVMGYASNVETTLRNTLRSQLAALANDDKRANLTSAFEMVRTAAFARESGDLAGARKLLEQAAAFIEA